MLTDKHFTSSSSHVDKRGRVKKNDDSTVNNLKEYYRIENDSELAKNEEKEDDVESEENDEKLLKSSSESDSESESGDEEEEELVDDYNSTDTDEDEGGYLEMEEDMVCRLRRMYLKLIRRRTALRLLIWIGVKFRYKLCKR